MRVLVDGMDLTGKTTLAWRLVEELRANGVPAVRHVGPVVPGVLARWTQRAYRRHPPGSAPVSWGYAACAALDALMGDDAPEQLVIQEVGPDHAAAFAEAFGRLLPARLIDALRPWWPRWDFAVNLRARLPTLQARYRLRDHNDAVDTLLFTDTERFMAIEERLSDRMKAGGAMSLQTDDLTPSELVQVVRPWVEDAWWARQASRLRAERRVA